MIFVEFEPEPMESNAPPLLIVYIIFAAFGWYLTTLLYKRWRSKQKKATMLLFLTFLMLTVCISGLLVGFIQMVITGLKLWLYRFSLAFAYVFLSIGNIFLMEFAAEIFTVEKKYIRKYQVAMGLIAIMVALPWNYYGWPQEVIDVQPIPSIRMYSQLALLTVSILVYSRIFMTALHASKRVSDKYAKVAFRYIAFSQISEILFFVFILLDVMTFTFTPLSGYTVFVYIAWCFVGLFFLFCYLGYIMPNWLRQRIDRKIK
ncbi:MAG: hypothetical protein ACTSRZ_18130 [Promethearchaeota archaeon]